MSALPPIADMCGALAHVRFVPIADVKQLHCWLWHGRRIELAVQLTRPLVSLLRMK